MAVRWVPRLIQARAETRSPLNCGRGVDRQALNCTRGQMPASCRHTVAGLIDPSELDWASTKQGPMAERGLGSTLQTLWDL